MPSYHVTFRLHGEQEIYDANYRELCKEIENIADTSLFNLTTSFYLLDSDFPASIILEKIKPKNLLPNDIVIVSNTRDPKDTALIGGAHELTIKTYLYGL